VSHFDVTPQNVVFRDRKPIGLIDFDLTRPGSRLGEVVNTAMWWVPLFPEPDRDPALAMCNAPTRLAMFVDAYGLTGSRRATFCDVAIDGATRSWHRMQANAEQRGGGWARMWAEGVGDRILRRRAWMIEQRATIEAALGAGRGV
jgi:aminoglycoside phosphotransferase (APT) family kinase protein